MPDSMNRSLLAVAGAYCVAMRSIIHAYDARKIEQCLPK